MLRLPTPAFLQLLALACGVGALLSPRDYNALDPSLDPSIYDQIFTRRILNESAEYGYFSADPTPGTEYKVGIIGAGAAGLYAAMILESLGISYEILEASNRAGGRIWTYYFDEATWLNSTPADGAYYDYYDVGAMRFPGMPYMDRAIGSQNNSLINYINSKVTGSDQVQMIPYIFATNNTFVLYNDILRLRQQSPLGDPFQVDISSDGTVPDAFAALSPGAVWQNVLSEFTTALNQSFDAGFNKLMEYDSMSVREYLIGQGYLNSEVDWLETTNDATGHYDTALSQMTLEQWIFSAAPLPSWTTVNGGLSRIINGMLKSISGPVLFEQPVLSISRASASHTVLSVTTNTTTYQYNHVINTAPLGALQVIDMDTLSLDYGKRLAIRKLDYDPAEKIGMKFKTRWWENLPLPFKGGQSFSDIPIRRCVYPSYGVNTKDAAASMIASYAWSQDSSRLASYMTTAEGQAKLVNITLQDLARLNNVTYEFLQDQLLDVHDFSWYNSHLSIGAFAIFYPGEFSAVMPALMAPAANGRMHFGGEALSSGHAWIIGALNSAYRTVAEILAVEDPALLQTLVEKWGYVDEIDMGWYDNTYQTQ